MSGGQSSGKPYSYRFTGIVREENESDAANKAAYETMVSIKDSLLLLTSSCEIIQGRDGPYCNKHGRPATESGMRCDYLTSRLSGTGEGRSKEQVQQYVNDILGIKDSKTMKRLTG